MRWIMIGSLIEVLKVSFRHVKHKCVLIVLQLALLHHSFYHHTLVGISHGMIIIDVISLTF